MKQSQSSKPSQNNTKSVARTENKDNLDSRHREEETVKGDHITNNKKEHQSLNKDKS